MHSTPRTSDIVQSARNKGISVLYFLGESVHDIAKKYELSSNRVYVILEQEDTKMFLKELADAREHKFKSLWTNCIDVMDDAMNSSDPKVALAGAGLYARVSGRMIQKIKVEQSAEDVVKTLLEKYKEMQDLENFTPSEGDLIVNPSVEVEGELVD